MNRKITYIDETGLVRCGMCSVRAGASVYLPRQAFSDGMLASLDYVMRTGKGRCICCLECFAVKREKEFITKSARGEIDPKYGVQYDRTWGHPMPGDELYRQFVFPKQQQKRVSR